MPSTTIRSQRQLWRGPGPRPRGTCRCRMAGRGPGSWRQLHEPQADRVAVQLPSTCRHGRHDHEHNVGDAEQGPGAMVIAKLCDLQPAPVVDEVLAPGRPPLDDRDGRPADFGLQADLVAGLRRHAALAVAADAGDVGLGRAGGGACYRRQRRPRCKQGGTLGPAAGLAPWQGPGVLSICPAGERLGSSRPRRTVAAVAGVRPEMASWERLSRRAARPGGLPVSACSSRGAPAGRPRRPPRSHCPPAVGPDESGGPTAGSGRPTGPTAPAQPAGSVIDWP
jgi:hypothetical protein